MRNFYMYQTVRYHLTTPKKRTTISIDEIISDLFITTSLGEGKFDFAIYPSNITNIVDILNSIKYNQNYNQLYFLNLNNDTAINYDANNHSLTLIAKTFQLVLIGDELQVFVDYLEHLLTYHQKQRQR